MRLISTLALATAVFLTGCAATVTRDAKAPAASGASPAAAKTVVLEVYGARNIGSGEDWDALLEEWQTSMSAAAASKGAQFKLAKAEAARPSGPAVLVKMKVNDFRYVSQAKRYAVGVFAGNAFMDLDVEFVELPQLKTFANRKFQTSSSAWQGVFSAMTPKQVEAVSKEIMSEVAGD
ncbi:MAG: DUF4410 domain-containing protein [Hydrogenophaga sp.]|jgi:hypothetical protein|uniref:DUF4410 domain-containing protein n=1 Tax=Hydrogenophaga sp. TaxID=1904254 RepID=UPI001DAC0367|nr:DUF4410 domain-containing protein [Hydrogenophaga sp.]MBW0172445.1 DUF4410 domain-containing protein [Hydrogenophaga sp.]MBW0184628.1 DUF4410 domain-containing protein [Hydrogenophaga sp.]